MYGSRTNPLQIAIFAFLAGWVFGTFFDVGFKDGTVNPIKPAQTQRR